MEPKVLMIILGLSFAICDQNAGEGAKISPAVSEKVVMKEDAVEYVEPRPNSASVGLPWKSSVKSDDLKGKGKKNDKQKSLEDKTKKLPSNTDEPVSKEDVAKEIKPEPMMPKKSSEKPTKLKKKGKKKGKKKSLKVEDKVIKGLNKFAFDFHKTLPKDGSQFYSPYSIAATLSQVYAGAKGRSSDEIASAFGWERLSSTVVHDSLGKLQRRLTKKSGSMLAVNKLWIDNTARVWRNFTKFIQTYYGTKVEKLNFFGKPDISRKRINLWVEENTKGKIKDLIPRGAIDARTLFVLTNAVHFKAFWLHKFDPKLTTLGEFTTTADKVIRLKMMKGNFKVKSIWNDDFIGVELPYKGERFSMIVLMPQDGPLDVVEKRLSNDMLEKMESYEGTLKVVLPKFKLTNSYEIVENLKMLNISTIFGDKCDFSGMLQRATEPIFITDVIHKAFVTVNEKGTEAAAATAMFLGRTIAPSFVADRPFLFFIKDTFSNAILFGGRFSPS